MNEKKRMMKISIYMEFPELEIPVTDEDIAEVMEAALDGLDEHGFVVTGIVGQNVDVELVGYNGEDDSTVEINEEQADETVVISWGEDVYK